MLYTLSHLQKLYSGFNKTPNLWSGDSIYGLRQLEIDDNTSVFNRTQNRKLRLGQLAEQFVFNQIEHSKDFELLAENIQIQNGKETIGELDALISMESKPIHVEIVYKFFLFDDTVPKNGLQNWIGPNRRDSLIEKLEKLTQKQLPLLHSQFTKPYLQEFKLRADDINQKVIFKAQLFTPDNTKFEFNDLNPEAHLGYYYRFSQLEKLKNHKFYIPRKIDWFLVPEVRVNWLTSENFRPLAKQFLHENRAFMFWMKKPNGELSKSFLVWW
ncbi:MAG: DUF1853 family protein [Bacteroidota bacterium]